MRSFAILMAVLAACLGAPAGALAAKGQGGAAAPAAGLRVVVSVAPLKGIVEPLLPAGSTVEVLIPPGVSEHGYEIPMPALARLVKSDLVVLVGLGLESRVEKFLKQNARAGLRVVEFAAAVGVEAPEDGRHEHADHDEHEHDHDHAHQGADPHLWLDPALVIKFAPALGKAIGEVQAAKRGGGASEEDSKRLEAALRGLTERLNALDASYRQRLGRCPSKTMIVAHDAWGRLAERYGLKTIALTGLTAGEPTPKAIGEAVAAVKASAARAVFCEPQLSAAAGERVAAATGVPLLRIDPLGDGDYVGMMRRNLDAIVKGLGGAPEPAGAADGSGK